MVVIWLAGCWLAGSGLNVARRSLRVWGRGVRHNTGDPSSHSPGIIMSPGMSGPSRPGCRGLCSHPRSPIDLDSPTVVPSPHDILPPKLRWDIRHTIGSL